MEQRRDSVRRKLLDRTLVSLFGTISPESYREIEENLEVVHLKGGEWLFSQGEPGDSMYMVMGGRLRALGRSDGGGDQTIGEISRGESVGEMALITDEPRSASIVAIRDSILIRLSKASFERLIRSQPDLLLNLSRLVIRRLTRSQRGRGRNSRIRSIAVVFAGESVAREEFIRRFSAALGVHGSTLNLNRERVEALSGIFPAAEGTEADRYLASWLDEQDGKHRFLVYEAEDTDSPWTRRCIRQADRVLVVAGAKEDPAPRGVEADLLVAPGPLANASRDLVLVHMGEEHAPSGTNRWLDPRGSLRHYHLRWGRGADMERLARVLAGKGVGIVFSGGGAKGFAHIGVLKALREASIPIDMVGGTSMGAILAAGISADWDFDTYLRTCLQSFSRGNPMGGISLMPLVSFFSGERLDSLLKGHFGGGEIEDLWIPFYCASSNLTTGSVEFHDRGPLWKALRASASLPGVFPPVVYGNHLHIDGGTLDNLPVSAAREFGAGVVIACDLDLDKQYRLDYQVFPSNWELFKDRYITRRKRLRVPDLPSIVFQATLLGNHEKHEKALVDADIHFRPKVRKISFLDWSAFGQAVEIGYLHAKERLEKTGRAWLDPNFT
jgi:NTE family protein